MLHPDNVINGNKIPLIAFANSSGLTNVSHTIWHQDTCSIPQWINIIIEENKQSIKMIHQTTKTCINGKILLNEYTWILPIF